MLWRWSSLPGAERQEPDISHFSRSGAAWLCGKLWCLSLGGWLSHHGTWKDQTGRKESLKVSKYSIYRLLSASWTPLQQLVFYMNTEISSPGNLSLRRSMLWRKERKKITSPRRRDWVWLIFLGYVRVSCTSESKGLWANSVINHCRPEVIWVYVELIQAWQIQTDITGFSFKKTTFPPHCQM